MASYPIEIRRCGHIRTNGTQCGSPALKEKEFCYYHVHNPTRTANLYIDGERYADGQIMIPPFEDAHAIQMVLRHVVQLLFERRIERKDAGLALYALQIASGNLKTMQAEKAKPTEVVVEPEKVGETPLGMTPWSASGKGHDVEEEQDAGQDAAASETTPAPPPTAQELYGSLTLDQRLSLRGRYREEGKFKEEEFDEYLHKGGADPLLLVLIRQCAVRDRKMQAELEAAQVLTEEIAGGEAPESENIARIGAV